MGETHEPSQEITKSDAAGLNGRELKAIQMKYVGKSSREISSETGFDEGYVRQLFKKDGRLSEPYEIFAEDMTRTVVQKIKSAAVTAIDQMIDLSQNAESEPVLYKAIEFLIMNSGHLSDATLKHFFANKTYEQAKKILDELFKDLYGKELSSEGYKITYSWGCEKCGTPQDSSISL